MFKRVVIGGTFDMLHKGHKALIGKAFEIGKRVSIGLTTDGFAKRLHSYQVDKYANRLKRLRSYLREGGFLERGEIFPISDHVGILLRVADVDAVVVSDETMQSAVEINRLREERGLQPFEIVRVETVLADDGEPVSVTRIHKGEITPSGRVLRKRHA